MTSFNADYSNEITRQSHQQLLLIAKWANITKSPPFLVGGWAVYHYLSQAKQTSFEVLGSRDIDLIFKNKGRQGKVRARVPKAERIQKKDT
jgi:hypothetical protein